MKLYKTDDVGEKTRWVIADKNFIRIGIGSKYMCNLKNMK